MGFSLIFVMIHESSYYTFGVFTGGAECGGVVQCGAVCCSVLQCVAVCAENDLG